MPIPRDVKPVEVSRFVHPLNVTARDVVTGLAGVIVGRIEWTTGCRQYCLAPPVGEDGSYREGQYFDEDRLVVLSEVQPDQVTLSGTVGGPAPARAPRK